MSIRNFRLIGEVLGDSANATITINGVEVYNGPLNTDSEILAEGSADINDSTEVTLPVKIDIFDGNVMLGTIGWNYGIRQNPLLTPEEQSYIIIGTRDESDNVVTPNHVDPSTPVEVRVAVESKGGFFVKDENFYTSGDTPELHQSNRSNLKINNVPVDGPSWYHYLVGAGSNMTYNVTVSPRA